MATVYDIDRRVTYTRDGVTVNRRLRVTPYSEVPYVADLLLGGCRLVGGYLVRIPPCRDPWLPWCICSEVQEEGLGTWTQSDQPSGLYNLIRKASYSQGAFLNVTYRTPTAGESTLDPRDGDLEDPPPPQSGPPTGQGHEPTNQQEIDLASESYDFGYQYLTQDGHAVGLADAVGQTPAKLLSSQNSFITKRIPKIEVSLVRHYVIRAPWTAISKLVGTVNKSAFRRGRVSWPRETMRFEGLQSQRKLTSFGVKHWELTLKFSILIHYDNVSSGGKNYVGWNRHYDWKDGVWRYVVAVNNNNKTLFEYDEDNVSQTINGSPVTGFNLLFHPRAT